MPKMTATLEGGPELARALAELEKQLWGEEARAAVQEGADIIGDEWRGRVPTGQAPEDEHPGLYRDAITVRTRVGKKGATGLVNVKGRPQVEYGATLEFGRYNADSLGRRIHIPPQPSARPAFDASKDRALAAIGARLKVAAEKVGK